MTNHETSKGSGSPSSSSAHETQTPPVIPEAPPPPSSGSVGVSEKTLKGIVEKGQDLYQKRRSGNSREVLQVLEEYFNSNYKTETKPIPERGDAYLDVETRFSKLGGPGKSRYHTYINVETGEIVIDHVERDDNLETIPPDKFFPKGGLFPCSEILYQQFKLVCIKKDAPKLTQITQEGVTGGGTGSGPSSQQIITSYIKPEETEKYFGPDEAGFYAILSTINGKNAAFLIKDHGKDLGIGSIIKARVFFKKGSEKASGRGKLCFSMFFSKEP